MAGGVTEEPGSAGWVGAALNGSGSWKLRGRVPYLLGFLMLFDSWDSVVIAYTLPSIGAEWKLSPLTSGWLISAGYGGQFLGAILFGAVAQRRGRLPVVRWLVVAMGLLAACCALAESYGQLVALRFVQGMAIGGALPAAICYVNEVAPTATRGKFFGTFQFLMLAGFGLASLASAWLVPHYGWRVMFALGVTPLLLVPVLGYLPESPRWLAGRGHRDAAAESLRRLGSVIVAAPADAPHHEAAPQADAPVSELFAPAVRGRFSIAAALWFLTALVSFGLLNWVPSIYVRIFDIPIDKALSYNSIVAVSIFLLPALLRQTIDRIGRRPPAIIGTAVCGVALLAILLVPKEQWMLVVGLAIIGQIGISISSIVVWPYTAEIFSTRIRAVALGTSSSLARAASMLTPLVVGGVLELTGSVTPVFLIFGVASLAVTMLWWRGTHETAGRDLDI
jgi:MFS transporter, putative metabolite:H+ symporter